MEVTFISKNTRRRLELNLFDENRGVIVNFVFTEDPITRTATYTTSDKKNIKLLMTHKDVRQGTIIMDQPEELVADYLTNESRKDRFTEEMIGTISDKAAESLGAHYRLTHTNPDLIRFSLVGRIVTRVAEDIIAKYPLATKREITGDEILNGLVKLGVVEKKRNSYIEVGTDEIIGNHAQAVEWAMVHKDLLEQPNTVE